VAIFKVRSQHLPGNAEENYENSEYGGTRPRFQSRTKQEY